MRASFTVLLPELEIADGLRSALARRELPERYSYWFPASVQAWLDLCGDGAYRNYVRSSRLIDTRARELAALALRRAAAGRGIEVISLGAGQADKDIAVLRMLRSEGGAPLYRPVDASQSLLELAGAAAEEAGFTCAGVKADLSLAAHLEAIAGMRDERPALWLLLGNTLGAFDPRALAANLRRVVGPCDTLVLDAELLAGEATIAGYDNPLNRAFAFAPLAALGLEPEDGELRFTLVADTGLPGYWRLAKHFETARDRRLRLGGESFELRAGERLHMGHSGKFSREGFRALAKAAGFDTLAEWTSHDDHFVMSVVA